MRRFVCAAFCVVSAVIINGQEKSAHATADQHTTAPIQQPAQPSAPIVVIHQEQTRNDSESSKNDSETYLHRFAAPENLPNLLLVIVAGITAAFIYKQARESARATSAMRESTELQKAGMQQWIDVETNRMHANFEKAIVNLHFRIVNNTDYPFTIQKIVTKASFKVDWEVFTVTTNVTIPPRRKTESDGYPFYISVTLNNEEMEWIKKGTIVTINGEIGFLDCLRRPDTDYFGGLYRVGENVFEYLEPVGIKPDHQTERYQNPN